MRSTIEEYGYLMVGILFAVAVVFGVVPLFLDGGTIKEAIVNYISNLC